MNIIKSDFKKSKKATIKITSLDDLWHLSHVIDAGDIVTSKTTRKIVGDKDVRKKQISKKTVTLSLVVEKVAFHKTADMLRLTGTVESEHKDIPKGSYHTIEVAVDTVFTIVKDEWKQFQIQRLKDYADRNVPLVLICVIDREQSVFGLLKDTNINYLSEVKGNVAKKYDGDQVKQTPFYPEAAKVLVEYSERYNPFKIIVAGPSFFKEDFADVVKQQSNAVGKKIIYAECHLVSKHALNEVVSRPEVSSVLKESRLVQDSEIVEKFFLNVSRSVKNTYGFSHVKEADKNGAVEILLVTDDFIHSLRQNDSYEPLDKIMISVEQKGGQIRIIDSRTTPGQRVDGIGGVCAILRYDMS